MARISLTTIAAAIILVPLPLQFTQARQKQTAAGERVVVCVIRLEHADAEHLASVLKPFLSTRGSLTAYAPINTLIIKDQASIVNMLSEIIKGQECTPIEPPSQNGATGIDRHIHQHISFKGRLTILETWIQFCRVNLKCQVKCNQNKRQPNTNPEIGFFLSRHFSVKNIALSPKTGLTLA